MATWTRDDEIRLLELEELIADGDVPESERAEEWELRQRQAAAFPKAKGPYTSAIEDRETRRRALADQIIDITRRDTACGCCRNDAARRRHSKRFWLLAELARLDAGGQQCTATACCADLGHEGLCPDGPDCPTEGCYIGVEGHEGACDD